LNLKEIGFFGNNYGHTMFPLSNMRIEMNELLNRHYRGQYGVYGNNWNNVSGNFNHSQAYSDISLAGEFATTFGAIAKTALDGGVDAAQRGRNLSPFVLQQLTKIAGSVTGSPKTFEAIFAGASQLAQNPQLELIYGKPDFRSFRFSFMFYPRSEKEAEEVYKLIQRLKFHQAPEIKNGTAGFFLVPPSEFDIEFYYNGQINPNIPTISTCVLQSIDLDYAPNGFHSFETPGDNSPKIGGTGTPVAIRMDLSFKETEIMTKFNFQDGERSKAEFQASAALGNFNETNFAEQQFDADRGI
jgi:hypothetical protein